MIITIEETKNLLGITNSNYDEEIQRLIPIITNDLIEYLNRTFEDKNTIYISGTIEFTTEVPGTITDTQSLFISEGFQAGMDISVEGTYRNSGIYHIDSLAAGTITLSSGDTIVKESSTDEYGGNAIKISRVRWPIGIKPYVAGIIWENITRVKNRDVRSKSLGPSSVTYAPVGTGGYNQSIIAGLNKYRYARLK